MKTYNAVCQSFTKQRIYIIFSLKKMDSLCTVSECRNKLSECGTLRIIHIDKKQNNCFWCVWKYNFDSNQSISSIARLCLTIFRSNSHISRFSSIEVLTWKNDNMKILDNRETVPVVLIFFKGKYNKQKETNIGRISLVIKSYFSFSFYLKFNFQCLTLWGKKKKKTPKKIMWFISSRKFLLSYQKHMFCLLQKDWNIYQDHLLFVLHLVGVY